MNKADVMSELLPDLIIPAASEVSAFAPSNIALCKYWGKRDRELNLPTNSSLSISLGKLGTTTYIAAASDGVDRLSLNNVSVSDDEPFARKVWEFVSYFRRDNDVPIHIRTINTIPTAAGLASSASGFAALTMALDKYFQLNLPKHVLSAFARMGSGSASRSLYHGFVEWQKGERDDGMDSYAQPLSVDEGYWSDLRVGIVTVSSEQKKINSRDGMNTTVATSKLYEQWPGQAAQDLLSLKQVLSDNSFTALGEVAEHNALSMHATMISAWPPVLYWQPESVSMMRRVWDLRAAGTEVYLTMDAGPNIKLLFRHSDTQVIQDAFTGVTIVNPFIRS